MNSLLAIAPASRGFGFVVLDATRRAIDWGIKEVRSNKNAVCIAKAMEIIDSHRPTILTIEDWSSGYTRRNTRIRTLLRTLERVATKRHITVERLGLHHVRNAFAPFHAETNEEIASAVACLIPDLRPILPRPRNPWESQLYGMPIFKAGSLAISYFALQEPIRLS